MRTSAAAALFMVPPGAHRVSHPRTGFPMIEMHRQYAINGATGSLSMLMGKPSLLSLVPTDYATSVNPLFAPFTSADDVNRELISRNTVRLAGLKVVYSMSWRFVHTGRAGRSIVYIGFQRQGIIPTEYHSRRPWVQDAWEAPSGSTTPRPQSPKYCV